jgi:hypothetical protein
LTSRGVPSRAFPRLDASSSQAALVVGATATVIVLSLVAVSVPAVGLGLVVLCLALPIVLRRPLLLVYATVAAAFVTVPAAIPTTFVLGSYSLRAYEVLLVAAFVCVVATHRAASTVRYAELLLYGALVAWSIVGLANGNDVEWIVSDVRALVLLAFGFSIAGRLVGTPAVGVLVRLMVPVLWISAVLTLLGSAAGLPISGREEFASLSLSADAATRILSPATYASVGVICIAVALIIAGRATIRMSLPWLLPAAIIVGLSFSRNAVISIAVAVLVGLIAGRSAQSWVRSAGYVAAVLAVAALAWSVVSATSNLPVSAWVVQQVESFVGRVVEGISSTALATDGSARFRLDQEDPYLWSEIAEQPIVGHGFGHPYKPLFTGRFASEEQAEGLSRFAHNFYLWTWVKSGLLGLAAFVIAIVVPAFVAIRRGSTLAIGAAAGLLGLLAASFVAPMPVGYPTSLLVGLLGGACAGLVTLSSTPARERVDNEHGA